MLSSVRGPAVHKTTVVAGVPLTSRVSQDTNGQPQPHLKYWLEPWRMEAQRGHLHVEMLGRIDTQFY